MADSKVYWPITMHGKEIGILHIAEDGTLSGKLDEGASGLIHAIFTDDSMVEFRMYGNPVIS